MQSAVQELLSCLVEANAGSARPGKYSSFMTDRKRMPGQTKKKTGKRELRMMVSGITGLYWKYTIYHISIFIFMPFHLANNAAEVAVADAIEPIERVDK